MESLCIASGVNYKENFSDHGIKCAGLDIILDCTDTWLIFCFFDVWGEEGTEISGEYYLSEHKYKSRILDEMILSSKDNE